MQMKISKKSLLILLTVFFFNVYNFSARLAAATGAADNTGLKEEGKKEGISGQCNSDSVD